MDITDYQKAALRTDYKTYDDYHTGEVSPRLDYATTGLVTESAKVLDLIKKSKKHIAPLDRDRVIEELGDLLWYFNVTVDELGIDFETIMKANLNKIERKYPRAAGDHHGLIRGE